jgi:hypothetical protein
MMKPFARSTAEGTTEAGAASRAFYAHNGYCVLRGLIRAEAIAAVHKVLAHEVYANSAPLKRHLSLTKDPHAYLPTADGQTTVANALLDPHMQTETPTLRRVLIDLICTTAVADGLASIDDARANAYVVYQIILFFVSPGTDTHIDGWGGDTVPPGGQITLWIPLEPVTPENGPVGIFPWPKGQFLSDKDLGIDIKSGTPREIYDRYHGALKDVIHERGIPRAVPQLGVGDLLAFSSLTPHMSLPPRREGLTRMALQVLIRPVRSPWRRSIPQALAGEIRYRQPYCAKIGTRWRVPHSAATSTFKWLWQSIRRTDEPA